jgi:hypothetical protein
MKTLTYLIILIGLAITSGVMEPVIIRTTEVDTVTIFRSVYDYQPNKKYQVPNPEILENMDRLAQELLLPIEEYIYQRSCKKAKIPLNSFYRTWSGKSEHKEGLAVDINIRRIKSRYNVDINSFIMDSLDYGQMIFYGSQENPSHVHLSVGCKKENLLAKRYWSRKKRRYITYYKPI